MSPQSKESWLINSATVQLFKGAAGSTLMVKYGLPQGSFYSPAGGWSGKSVSEKGLRN